MKFWIINLWSSIPLHSESCIKIRLRSAIMQNTSNDLIITLLFSWRWVIKQMNKHFSEENTTLSYNRGNKSQICQGRKKHPKAKHAFHALPQKSKFYNILYISLFFSLSSLSSSSLCLCLPISFSFSDSIPHSLIHFSSFLSFIHTLTHPFNPLIHWLNLATHSPQWLTLPTHLLTLLSHSTPLTHSLAILILYNIKTVSA